MEQHLNLALARELICCFVELENDTINATGNESILIQLEACSDTVFKPLPSDTDKEISENLQVVLEARTSDFFLLQRGRNKDAKEYAQRQQRKRIQLCARACLALLAAGRQVGA